MTEKRKKLFNIIVLIICGLSGCSTVQQARLAQQEDGVLRGETTVTAVEAGIRVENPTQNNDTTAVTSDSQQRISPMSMKELEDIAVRYSPDVAQARQEYLSAELDLKEVKADYLPMVSGTVGYELATSNEDRHNQNWNTDGQYNGSLDLEVLLFDFGKTSSRVKQAAAKLLAAQQNLRNEEILAVYNVRKSFFAVKRAMELDVVATMAVEQYKQHLDQTLVRKDAGVATYYDFTKAEVDWNNAVLNAIKASNYVETSWANLNFFLCLAENPKYQIGEWNLPDLELDTDKLMQLAKTGDPTLSSFQAQVRAASYYVDKTIADLYPTISLDLTTSLAGDSFALPLLWNFSGIGSLVEKIYNGNKNMLAIEKAVAQLRIARSQVAAREQEIFRDIQKAVLTAIGAKKQYDVAQVIERQAKENLDIVNEMFDVGKASSVDRTDAQVSNSSAQADVVTAKFDYLDSQAYLSYLTGQ